MPLPPKPKPEIPIEQKSPEAYTIRDIAKLAGVSRSTVSLALNNSPKINELTRARVQEVIEQVGYRPNQSARNLVRQQSHTILVILPPINHVFSDYYFSESLSGILEATMRRQYHLMVEMATDDFKREKRALQLHRQRGIDGALCVGGLTTDHYLEELAEAGCPLVLVNSNLPEVNAVVGANAQSAFRAIKHLKSLGHTRIGHIKGSEQVTSAIDRTHGYLMACEELGLEFDADLITQGYFGQRSGHDAMKQLLVRNPRPTAVFAGNDLMAIGAIAAAKEHGLRVPEDIAIFGGDDIQLASYVRPALSTMRQSMYTIGQTACENLFLQLEGKPVSSTVRIGMRLVIRESCGAAQAGSGRAQRHA